MRTRRQETDGVADELLAMLRGNLPTEVGAWAIDLLCTVLHGRLVAAAAVAHVRALVPRYARLPILHARLAQGHLLLGERELARQCVARALELDPGQAIALEVQAALAGGPR
ncbi:MAG: hypothetical protein FJ265_20390 [Planctomycetes bacterium]|nr:hypothetical protein [Planctomycetota bacterium]